MAPTTYHLLVEEIIKKQATVLGLAVAIRRARNVSGLLINDEGVVQEMPANIPSALESLVEQYKALSGSMGVEFCKEAASSFRREHPEMQLPPILS